MEQTNKQLDNKEISKIVTSNRPPTRELSRGMMANADRGQASCVITSLLFMKNKLKENFVYNYKLVIKLKKKLTKRRLSSQMDNEMI